MARLSVYVSNLGEPTFKLLEQNKIFSVLDFVEEDPDKISYLTGLSFKAVTDIKKDLISKFAAKPVTGLEVYNNILSKAAKLSTGIECLDHILEGGFLTGSIYEICGLSGEGKTQLCFAIAVHISHNVKQTVHYVDSKHDFSASRIQGILKAQSCNDDEVEAAMRKIQVTKVENVYQLINFLHSLEKICVDNPCRLVIIDSLPVLLTPLLSPTNKDGLGLLNHISQIMKYISSKFQIAFLVVNLALIQFEEDETLKPGCSDSNTDCEISYMGDLKPALGKAWLHSPSYRILIQKHTTLNLTQRLITLVKSIDIQTGKKCIVEISNAGVVST